MSVAIALQNPKTQENVAAVLRLALCWSVDFVITVGARRLRAKHALNTMATEKTIPFLHFDSMRSLADAWPDHWVPIGVEMTPDAEDMRGFVHPRSALYLFGPEDGSLSAAPLRPRHNIVIPTKRCLNLAHAVGITLYDRATKMAQP